MNMKKYGLVKSNKPNLFRIVALKDFADVKEGETGGYYIYQKSNV